MTVYLSLPRLWAVAALVCIFVAVSFTWVYPADFWWHLRVGEEILSGNGIPTADVYSFTARGQPFVYQYWLSEALLALTYRMGGIPLIVLLNAISFTVAYGLLLSICVWMADGSLRVAAAAAFGGFLLGVENWAVRPQTFSVVLFALTLWLLWRYALGKGGPRSLILFPLITGLWANLHGAFPLGLALQGAFILGLVLSRVRRLPFRTLPEVALLPLCLALVGSGLATLATPYGLRLYVYLFTILIESSIREFIVEWARPTLGTAPGNALFISIGLLLLLWVVSHARVYAPSLVSLVVVGLLALSSQRQVLWFGFVAAPVAATLLAGLAAKVAERLGRNTFSDYPQESHARALSLAVLLFLLFLCLAALPWLRPLLPLPAGRQSLVSPDTPVAATEALLAEGSPGRTFADMQYASYLLWRAPGEASVFADSRIELYSYNLWVDYGTISSGQDPHLLEQYRVEALLLSRGRQSELLRWVSQQSGWRRVYEDSRSSAWLRTQ